MRVGFGAVLAAELNGACITFNSGSDNATPVPRSKLRRDNGFRFVAYGPDDRVCEFISRPIIYLEKGCSLPLHG